MNYELDDGRVEVSLTEKSHSSVDTLEARRYAEDDTRMGYYSFAVPDRDGHEANFQHGSTERPPAEVIAAVHNFGYTISNLSRTTYDPDAIDMPDRLFLAYAHHRVSEMIDEYDSEYVQIWLEGVAYVLRGCIVPVKMSEEVDSLDSYTRRKNKELLTDRNAEHPEDFREVVQGNFVQAVNPTPSRREEKAQEALEKTERELIEWLQENL